MSLQEANLCPYMFVGLPSAELPHCQAIIGQCTNFPFQKGAVREVPAAALARSTVRLTVTAAATQFALLFDQYWAL